MPFRRDGLAAFGREFTAVAALVRARIRWYDRPAFLTRMGVQRMSSVTLSATPKGNGFQATITYANGVGISLAESYPTKAEAISAAAMKLLDMPERLEAFDAADADI